MESDEVLFRRLKKYGHTIEQIKEELDLAKLDKGVTGKLPDNHIVIRLQKFSNNTELADLVLHESSHAKDFILYNIGAKFENDISDEVFTYLHEYINREILKKLKL
jgi:hypothetical protein